MHEKKKRLFLLDGRKNKIVEKLIKLFCGGINFICFHADVHWMIFRISIM